MSAVTVLGCNTQVKSCTPPHPPPYSVCSQLAGLGEVFKSSEAVRLTEEDTEYVVMAVKHVFSSALVVQYDCTNTIPEQVCYGEGREGKCAYLEARQVLTSSGCVTS
jgi:hypothetical protein